MSTGWIITLSVLAVLGVVGVVYGIVVEAEDVAEAIGRGFAVVFLTAAFGGTLYGGFLAVSGDDPLGLGWNAASAAQSPDDLDPCDTAGAAARFHPGC